LRCDIRRTTTFARIFDGRIGIRISSLTAHLTCAEWHPFGGSFRSPSRTPENLGTRSRRAALASDFLEVVVSNDRPRGHFTHIYRLSSLSRVRTNDVRTRDKRKRGIQIEKQGSRPGNVAEWTGRSEGQGSSPGRTGRARRMVCDFWFLSRAFDRTARFAGRVDELCMPFSPSPTAPAHVPRSSSAAPFCPPRCSLPVLGSGVIVSTKFACVSLRFLQNDN
jgi:hypothetical protein